MHTPIFILAASLFAAHTLAASAPSLPIREITAFKDGHALVLRSGKADVTSDGDITLTDLPQPIMGTFWAEVNEPATRLASVTVAGPQTAKIGDANTLGDLLHANINKTISFGQYGQNRQTGVLIDVTGYPHAPIAIVRIGADIAVVPNNGLQNIRFVGGTPIINDASNDTIDPMQERMILDLDWDEAPKGTADVSLMYVQRGLRWIPSYRITMLDDDRARIKLQATIVNELADLNDVTMHMAIGVPTFAFENTPDPMALREQFDALGLFFRRQPTNSTGAMLSNALMSQVALYDEDRRSRNSNQPGNATSPSLAGGERAEDLYVFTTNNVTLAKGARMVLPLVTYEVSTERIYKLDFPAQPPVQMLRSFNTNQQRQLAFLLNRPTAKHILRLHNKNRHDYPITTAPALIVKDGRTLAQGLITYTAPNTKVDLEVGSAMDITVQTEESEAGRTPNAIHWDSKNYARIDIDFEANLTNRKPHPVKLEISRIAFGAADSVNHDGKATAINIFSNEALLAAPDHTWWRWYSWPYYWTQLNGATKFDWNIILDAGEEITLDASWHYLWR